MFSRTFLMLGLTMSLASAAAHGQVMTQTGHALDANYQLGSGGYVPGGVGRSYTNSQLIVNRQVTGLGYFHGNSITASNQLGMNVPSAGLSQFIQQSVGVQQVEAGRTYQTNPYFSSSRTVFGTAGMARGLTIPGGNAPPSSSSVAQRAYTELLRDYRAYSPAALTAAPVIRVPQGQAYGAEDMYFRPGADAAFGQVQEMQRQQLISELIENDQVAAMRKRLQASGEELPSDLDPNRPMSVEERRQRELQAAQKQYGGALPTANQDVYIDVLLNLQQYRGGKGPQPPVVSPDGRLSAAQPVVEVTPTGVVIHALAGYARDLFNQNMARGQVQLRKGEYYEAARRFDSAALVNGANPMARVGIALATFGAGEYFTSGLNVRRAVALFPPLMETRLAIGDMMSQKDFDRQLKALDERLATEQNEAMLLFVAAYMHQNMEHFAEARKYATMLTDLKTRDPIFEGYAQWVLTSKRPNLTPTTKSTRTPASRPAWADIDKAPKSKAPMPLPPGKTAAPAKTGAPAKGK